MLIKFQTAAYADIVMFGDVAVALLHMMGHSGTVPGALLAADIPAAIARLHSAVAAQATRPLNPATGGEAAADNTDEQAQSVNVAHRAWPLLQLLTAAAAQQQHVLWDYH